ncbi:MAG: ribosome maturation factor RimM [Vicinamibacterales bacterium]
MTGPWDDLVLVGVVARPHGVRGQVIVNAEATDPTERFVPGFTMQARVRGADVELVVERVSFLHGRPILTLRGVRTRDEAAALQGAELRVPAAALPALPEGSYYHYELVGCAVTLVDGRDLGRVARVDDTSGTPSLVVDRDGGECLIPLADSICQVVDVKGRRIVVAPPEGLVELNAPRSR